MRARLTWLLLSGPILLLPLQLEHLNGPFNLSWTPAPLPVKEKPLVQQIFSGTGAPRSPFGNGR